MKNNLTVKKISFAVIGIALFVVTSAMLQVPFFENYYFCLGYIVMGVYCYIFGTWMGVLVGGLGTPLYCVLTNGFRGMPGWTLGNIFIAIALGYLFRWTKKCEDKRVKIFLEVFLIILCTAIGILGIKSLTEVILYSQPLWARALKNFNTFITDSITLVISLPVAIQLEKYLINRKEI